MAMLEAEDFEWGAVGRTEESITYYESFTFDGIYYRLFDCVYFLLEGQCETSIGQIVSMFETSEGDKKIKVVWFFRPIDIRNFLGTYEPRWCELFLASGDGPGVYNINPVEEILGKCNVLCVSNDPRNPQPTAYQLRNSQYVFSRTFDTGGRIISQHFPEEIAGIRVERFFNNQPLQNGNTVPGLLH